jgi:hypothetical protein
MEKVSRGIGVLLPMFGGILFFCWAAGLTVGGIPPAFWLGIAGFCAGVWIAYVALWLSHLSSTADIYVSVLDLQLDEMREKEAERRVKEEKKRPLLGGPA